MKREVNFPSGLEVNGKCEPFEEITIISIIFNKTSNFIFNLDVVSNHSR